MNGCAADGIALVDKPFIIVFADEGYFVLMIVIKGTSLCENEIRCGIDCVKFVPNYSVSVTVCGCVRQFLCLASIVSDLFICNWNL